MSESNFFPCKCGLHFFILEVNFGLQKLPPFANSNKILQMYPFSLTFTVPITIAADDIFFFFFFFIYLFIIFFFLEETSLDISCDSSAKQMIHMKCQDLFSLKNYNKIKNFRLSSATKFAWCFKG